MEVRNSMLMIVHSHYPLDTRVRREAEALVEAGIATDVVCLRAKGETARQDVCGVSVHRLPVDRHRGASLAVYLAEYAAFFGLASATALGLHVRRRYAVVQAHNLPDWLVFAAIGPRLLGARTILDIHDLQPELAQSKLGLDAGHWLVQLQRVIERASTAFADHVITVREPFAGVCVRAACRPASSRW